MRAVAYTAPLTLELLDVEEPTIPEGEVMVKVAAAGICGSELEGFANQSPLIACGRCDLCLRGLSNVCRNRQIIGIQRDGGFAEYVAVPSANCHLLDASVPFAEAALIEPLANSVHAVRLALGQAPDAGRIGIVGAGMPGVAMTLVAKAMTGASVTMTDLSADRLAVAESAGADETGASLIREFDVVFDGRDVIRNEKRAIGSFCYTDTDVAVAVPLGGRVRSEWLDLQALDDGVAAFTRLLETVPTTIKTVLVP